MAAPKPIDERKRLKVLWQYEVLDTVRSASLANRRMLIEALPQRFAMALEEALRLAEPKAVRVALPSATIKNDQELDTWVNEARSVIEAQLEDGPVIV